MRSVKPLAKLIILYVIFYYLSGFALGYIFDNSFVRMFRINPGNKVYFTISAYLIFVLNFITPSLLLWFYYVKDGDEFEERNKPYIKKILIVAPFVFTFFIVVFNSAIQKAIY